MRLSFLPTFICATLVALPLRAEYTPPIRDVVTYGEAAQLVQISAPALSDIAQEAWDTEFMPSSYFSAFALSKSGGYGYASTTNSRSAAREIAMAECLAHNAQCRLIAEILPSGFVEPSDNTATVTFEVAGYLADLDQQTGFRAAAVSADGAYSLVWGYDTRAEAEAAAMTDCEGFRRPPASPDAPTWPCVLLPGIK